MSDDHEDTIVLYRPVGEKEPIFNANIVGQIEMIAEFRADELSD